ncbi:MAG TPA: DUF882 domain-containing protein [Candidatus Limnocylindria bacterium]|nr:DUF882 domain-containing protein [Candidatus Limnocylindria bacterium]
MRSPLVAAAVSALAFAASAATASEVRFFVAGNGTLALRSMHTGAEARVTYRRPDGSYDPAALAELRRVLRSRDGREGPLEPRFVELLGWLWEASGGTKPLRIQSGYRSPAHNEAVRRRGGKAASGSLHTEGMASDVLLDRALLQPLWERLRALECCGAGYYPGGGFLHVDTGTPRFWDESTSRVDENLSAGNARVFARTDFDRYRRGDTIALRLHALTVPPLHIAPAARLDASGAELQIASPAPGATGCIEADANTVLRVPAAVPVARDVIVLAVCEPRLERTPETVRSNPVAIAD